MTFRLQRYEKKSKNPNKSRFFFVYRGDRPRDIGTVKWAPPKFSHKKIGGKRLRIARFFIPLQMIRNFAT